ncbi:MAG: hypothetical protein KF680_06410 [Cryobacterium sp.]|nr:hypothetical protein [Cryobacterium sp.]
MRRVRLVDAGGRPRSGRSPRAADRGAASVLAVALLAATLALTLACVPLYGALIERQRIAGAADAAALAAADVAVGREPGVPCVVAAQLAAANQAVLDRCIVDGVIVTVRVGSSSGIAAITATATAGPPGAR